MVPITSTDLVFGVFTENYRMEETYWNHLIVKLVLVSHLSVAMVICDDSQLDYRSSPPSKCFYCILGYFNLMFFLLIFTLLQVQTLCPCSYKSPRHCCVLLKFRKQEKFTHYIRWIRSYISPRTKGVKLGVHEMEANIFLYTYVLYSCKVPVLCRLTGVSIIYWRNDLID